METDPTQLHMDGGKHPSLSELRDPSHPQVAAHLASCEMCRRLVGQTGLELPTGLVSESAFRWPADAAARGGMAQIFIADDRRLARQVILKAPRDGEELPPALLQMFQQRIAAEARVLAKLQHPSIVTIYELGRASTGWPFCVLEKVEGRSLREQLDELAVDEAADGVPRTRARLELLSSLVSVAEAIAYAHERRVVHRDITPNNILLGKRGEATLIDWGIARDLDAPSSMEIEGELDASASGRMVTISAGTPPYIPLEQSQGRAAEPSFDVYSFGVCLYEVVSGKTPFVWKALPEQSEREAQMQAFLRWLASGENAPAAAPTDAELSGIIAKAMHRNPGERFTADELVRALKQYLTGELVFSHRYSLSGRVARWVRRRPAVAGSLAVALIAMVVSAVIFAQLSRTAQRAAENQQLAALAQLDATEKKQAAEKARQEADAASARADAAERQGQDARALRDEAERRRALAEERRAEFEQAAEQAKGDADDAAARFRDATRAKQEADKQRDEANAARATAEAAKAAADAARAEAEAARQGAIAERDQARVAERAAIGERDDAAAARASADAARTAAEAAREQAARDEAAARVERDEARAEATAAREAAAQAQQQLAILEARVRELEKRLAESGPGPSPPPSP